MLNRVSFEGVAIKQAAPGKLIVNQDDVYIIVDTDEIIEAGTQLEIVGRLNSLTIRGERPMVVTTIIPESIIKN